MNKEEIREQLIELVEAGEMNMSIPMEVYGYFKEQGKNAFAKKASKLLIDFYNDDISIEDVKESDIYKIILEELNK